MTLKAGVKPNRAIRTYDALRFMPEETMRISPGIEADQLYQSAIG